MKKKIMSRTTTYIILFALRISVISFILFLLYKILKGTIVLLVNDLFFRTIFNYLLMVFGSLFYAGYLYIKKQQK